MLFTLGPLLEIWILIELGGLIGSVPTIIIIAATGSIGVFLAKSQGLQVLKRFRERLNFGELPTKELFNAASILVGGALLLTPGLVTDLIGFSLLIPASRKVIKRIFYKKINKMIKEGRIKMYHSDFGGRY